MPSSLLLPLFLLFLLFLSGCGAHAAQEGLRSTPHRPASSAVLTSHCFGNHLAADNSKLGYESAYKQFSCRQPKFLVTNSSSVYTGFPERNRKINNSVWTFHFIPDVTYFH